ncbi:transposase [Synechococcus sp. R55.6]|uniref:hypothetical protein n=1 Tax=unclassified Synechococcus TaxID=2626047 RepID=UPI0039C3A0AE
MKRHQRRLSRKYRKGIKPQSKNYPKQRKRLGKVHLKVQRQRRDCVIKVTRCVVLAYGDAERFVSRHCGV